MKFIPFLLAGIAILLVRCGQEVKAAKLVTFEDSLSYSYGVQVAEMIKKQGDSLDAKMVARAVQEAMEKNPQLTMEQCQAVLQSSATRKVDKVVELGRSYLAENAKKEGVQVTESGLQYKMLVQGTGESPTAENTVTVHYRLRLSDGVQVESSYDNNAPATFPLNRVIKGWTEGLQLMKVGGKMELVVPSTLGYGPRTSGPIPGGSVLIFEIELLSITEQ
ncbi:MAG: FKBP-type peptidyl-prolyl cis-trans isomerase [Cytophagales bacterium]|nr:FKBP-type peptidyl-prolyl cis-trans isomerase [Cytophagales bacterium]